MFAHSSHPLVLFLDDIQWADFASLKWIERMLGEDEPCHLLLIGAYRDNEVGPAHPLKMLLDALRQGGACLEEMHLGPLHQAQTAELIADTTGRTLEEVEPLAELVHRKTEGGPLFVNELLKRMYQEELFVFNEREGSWVRDVARVEARGLTDNILELMVGNLKRLAVPTQQALKLAACLGHTFSLRTLAIIQERSFAETAALLGPALQAGFLLTASEPEVRTEEDGSGTPLLVHDYKFVHDRVQQAAYALIDEEERTPVHLRIGRLLAASTTAQERNEQLFERVRQLNLGRTRMTDGGERLALMQMNMKAARVARSEAAYASARDYFTVAMEVLSTHERWWAEHYELTLRLHQELGEIEYLNGNHEKCEPLLQQALTHARTPGDKADAHSMRVAQYTILGRYQEAFKEACEGLSCLGIHLSADDATAAVQTEFAELQKSLGGREPAALLHLPAMSDPHARSIAKLLGAALNPTFVLAQELHTLIVFKAMNLLLRYGPYPESLHLLATYGVILDSMTGQYRTGYEFGLVGLKLSERFDDLASKCKVIAALVQGLAPWVEHIHTLYPLHDIGYRAGLESGELLFAGLLLFSKLSYQLLLGGALSQVRADLQQFLLFNEKVKNQFNVDLLLGLKLIVANLTGATRGRLDFSEGDLTEAKLLTQCQATHNHHAICYYYVFKTLVLCHYGETAAALEASRAAERLIPAFSGIAPMAQHHFHISLLLAAEYPRQSREEQQKSWTTLEANQQQLKKWADSCPANHAHLKINPSLSIEDIERMLADVRLNGERILEHGKRADKIVRGMNKEHWSSSEPSTKRPARPTWFPRRLDVSLSTCSTMPSTPSVSDSCPRLAANTLPMSPSARAGRAPVWRSTSRTMAPASRPP